jgi:hypothetical protein
MALRQASLRESVCSSFADVVRIVESAVAVMIIVGIGYFSRMQHDVADAA